jgi:DnaK suppressor protein
MRSPMPKKLNAKELASFSDLLQRIRAVVSGDMSYLEEEAFGLGGQRDTTDLRVGDTADGYYQEFNLELLERDQTTLREIDDALGRIETGNFGLCETCGEPIVRERLKAMPHARNCIDCQRLVERNGGS